MLTPEEKNIIIAQGVSVRIKYEVPVDSEDDVRHWNVQIDGSGLFGNGRHLTDWREAVRLAWQAFWRLADHMIEHRVQSMADDPLARAIRMHRERSA